MCQIEENPSRLVKNTWSCAVLVPIDTAACIQKFFWFSDYHIRLVKYDFMRDFFQRNCVGTVFKIKFMLGLCIGLH